MMAAGPGGGCTLSDDMSTAADDRARARRAQNRFIEERTRPGGVINCAGDILQQHILPRQRLCPTSYAQPHGAHDKRRNACQTSPIAPRS